MVEFDTEALLDSVLDVAEDAGILVLHVDDLATILEREVWVC